MAQISSLEIILEFEHIVKLVCSCLDCKHNLYNSTNAPEGKQAACNLKQITIGRTGHCRNFEKFTKEEE